MRRALSLLLLALPALAACRGGESTKPPVHLVLNMDTQQKGRAYRKDISGLFADGRMMRAPVEGTVAVGQLDDEDILQTGLATDGQPTLAWPETFKAKLDDHLRARGKARFDIYCAPCHGVDGDGKGPVANAAIKPGLNVPPPSLHDARIKELPVGRIYAAIHNGVNAPNMPSYAAQIPVEDRWAIVAAVRALQKAKDPSVEEEGGKNLVVAKATTASAEHGAELFKAKFCNSCHTVDGNRLVGPTFKGLFGKKEKTSAGEVTVDEAYIKESLLQPMAKIVDGYPPAMPPQVLDEVEIQSLTLFIQAQK